MGRFGSLGRALNNPFFTLLLARVAAFAKFPARGFEKTAQSWRVLVVISALADRTGPKKGAGKPKRKQNLNIN